MSFDDELTESRHRWLRVFRLGSAWQPSLPADPAPAQASTTKAGGATLCTAADEGKAKAGFGGTGVFKTMHASAECEHVSAEHA